MTNCNPSLVVVISTYVNYFILVIFGYVRDSFRRWLPDSQLEPPKKGYPPLLRNQDDFYTRRLYSRCSDCFSRPICSRPGSRMDVILRESHDFNKTFTLTDEVKNCLNLGSYNYLGFAENPSSVTNDVFDSLDHYGINSCSPMMEYGYTETHRELEEVVARFLHKEAALCLSMGFATNSTVIPALCGPGSLIISDSLNHTSIVVGARTSGATVRVFKHDNFAQLERIIRTSIANGQPRTHKPWKKIIILVEGIYSMEGEIINLPEVVAIKKKYNCYLYVDEAHSIGALGPNGRGVCEHHGVSFDDIDILMGTFTKSFGAIGGYIASSRSVIDHIRNNSFSAIYGSSLPTGCAQQIISAFKVIMGEDGTDIGEKRLKALKENSDMFRNGVKELGFEVIGDDNSPVVIVMVYNPGKVTEFSRYCLERNVAVVVVGAPATDLIESRIRFCISAAHTKEDIEHALKVLDECGDITMTKYAKPWWYKLKQLLF